MTATPHRLTCGCLSGVILTGWFAGTGLAQTTASGRLAPWTPDIQRPSGFERIGPAFPTGTGPDSGILSGFSLSGFMSGSYDSNPGRGNTTPGVATGEDFTLSLGMSLGYSSPPDDLTFGGSYTGSYNAYLNNSDFSGFNQGLGLFTRYQAGRLDASLTVGIGFDSGSNRFYSSSLVERTFFDTALDCRYSHSPKTSLTAGFSTSFSAASDKTADSDYGGTGSYDMNLGALWKYSARTEFGPGIHYSHQTGETQSGRDSIGPTMSLNYKLSRKVTLNSRVGLDFPKYETGPDPDPSINTGISLNYRASRLWSMSLSFSRDVQPDPGIGGSFTLMNALRLGYTRKIRSASLNMGMSYDTSSSETTGSGSPDRDYVSMDASLGMPVFADSCFASLFTTYSQQQSNSATDDWDSFQAGFSISRSF